MAGCPIQMHTNKALDFSFIFEALERMARYEDMEEAARIEKPFGTSLVYLIVYEKYFMRIDSYASLSVLLTREESGCSASIVPSGGGNMINFSWGAEKDFANACASVLEELGFVREKSNEAEEPKGFFQRIFQ